jgi:hypothetical protein
VDAFAIGGDLHGPDRYESHPPLALVFTGAGPRGLDNRMRAVGDLTVRYWQPRPAPAYTDPGHKDDSGAIPVIAMTLAALQEHGPRPIRWRYVTPGAANPSPTRWPSPTAPPPPAPARSRSTRWRRAKGAAPGRRSRPPGRQQETLEQREEAAREAAKKQRQARAEAARRLWNARHKTRAPCRPVSDAAGSVLVATH